MNLDTFEKVSKELLDNAERIRNSKRKSYTVGSEDVLANFKNDGNDSGVTALQAWHLHFRKQIAAIASYVKSGDESEPVLSRFSDALNYLLLGWALITEGKITVNYKFINALLERDGALTGTGDPELRPPITSEDKED